MNNAVKKNTFIPIPEKVKILVDVCEWVVFIFLIAVFITIFSPFLPTNKYFQTYIVPTGSMRPTIPVGSVALTTVTQVDKLTKGDIITFTDPENSSMTILHRIYSVSHKGSSITFKTKGDNNNAVDPWIVPASLVKGKIFLVAPFVGYLGNWAKSPMGFGVLVVLPALLLVLLQVKRIKEGIEEEVVKRTHIALEKHHSSSNIFVLLFITGVITCLTVSFGHAKYSEALFTSSTNISDFRFSVKDLPKPCAQLVKDKDGKFIYFVLSNLFHFKKFHYILTYYTDDNVQEGIAGDGDLDEKKSLFTSGKVTLGTCSTGGICVYNKHIHNISLTVSLQDGKKTIMVTDKL